MTDFATLPVEEEKAPMPPPYAFIFLHSTCYVTMKITIFYTEMTRKVYFAYFFTRFTEETCPKGFGLKLAKLRL